MAPHPRGIRSQRGNTLFDFSPMQRSHRDAHAAPHHIALAWDPIAEQYGRVKLGLEPKHEGRL